MRLPVPPLLAAAALSLPRSASVVAQTDVLCGASCPPVGYESDSSHLCPGAVLDAPSASRRHAVCHPAAPSSAGGGRDGGTLSFDALKGPGRVTVVANYYTGCEAGRRESGVYAGVAQRVHDATRGRVTFVTSLKGGGDCAQWAGLYQDDAMRMGFETRPTTMPLTLEDGSYDVRDRFFTPPYPHPSYIVLDENLEVTYKGVGPCCGYTSYYACTDDVALALDKMLTDEIMKVYNKQLNGGGGMSDEEGNETSAPVDPTTAGTDNAGDVPEDPTTVATDNASDPPVGETESVGGEAIEGACQSTGYSAWSPCSKTCGDGGIQFRHRAHPEETVQTRPCQTASALPPCEEQCVPEFGKEGFDVDVVASGLASPRDLAFHPTPGVHLGAYAEGRTFRPNEGEELWIANGGNHSVSIVASLGTPHQTTIARRDRGYYHYMNNITALAFNHVRDSGRNPDQDSFNFFALCNDNANDYVGSKEPNYFMGPTLYDTDVVNKVGMKNTVTRAGADCGDKPADQCFFLHADMLHEAPACIGIAHDPEVETAYGTVYWAFDKTGDNGGDGGHLVRFDFSQPHGPGSMDHSVAVVRRYPEVRLRHDEAHAHGHAGMAVHPDKRVLYVANPGEGNVVAVHADTGRYSRTAREEYPIFTNKLPSFEYSIYECVEQVEDFATGLTNPTGLALSLDGTRLFVAERGGRIVALDEDSGARLGAIDLAPMGYSSIGGLAVSPKTGDLYFVDMDSNRAGRIEVSGHDDGECVHESRINADFQFERDLAQSQVDLECGEASFSLTRDYSCEVDGTIPNGTLFEQVHTDTGYASDDPDVQGMAGMDEAAALLAGRTDCERDSELNFDALLLGGYYCHVCLPLNHGSSCDAGGTCANIQWQGFTCDNEYYVDFDSGAEGPSLVISSLHFNKAFAKENVMELKRGVTYRFTVRTGEGRAVSIGTLPVFSSEMSLAESSTKSLSPVGGVTDGPILLTVDDSTPDCLYMASAQTRPITLMIGGVDECPGSGAGEPDSAPASGDQGNDQGSVGVRPGDDGSTEWELLPKKDSSAQGISVWGCPNLLLVGWAVFWLELF